MDADIQDVLPFVEPAQNDAEERRACQVELLGGIAHDCSHRLLHPHVCRQVRVVLYCQAPGNLGMDFLLWSPFETLETRSEHLMARDKVEEGLFERLRIQGTSEMHCCKTVVDSRTPLHLLDEPKPLL